MKITDGINKLSEKFNAFCENKKALKIVTIITGMFRLVFALILIWFLLSIIISPFML